MSVTDEVSQFFKSPLNEDFSENADVIVVTALTSQYEIGPYPLSSQFPYTGSISKHEVMAELNVLSVIELYGGGLSAGGGDGGTYTHFPGHEPSMA